MKSFSVLFQTLLLSLLLLAGGAFAADKVDINSADAAQLDKVLIGVGAAKAEAIAASILCSSLKHLITIETPLMAGAWARCRCHGRLGCASGLAYRRRTPKKPPADASRPNGGLRTSRPHREGSGA